MKTILSWILIPLLIIYITIEITLRKKAVGVLSKFKKENVILISSNANFYGLESIGVKQFRGNGTLVLTKDKLYFELLLPKKTIEIPINKIKSIEETRSHLGKFNASKLFKVTYVNETNSIDSCAWLVRKRKVWIEEIEKLCKASND